MKVVRELGGKVDADQKQKIGVSVWLANTKATDGTLKAVKEFKRLHTLDLSGTRVTDAAARFAAVGSHKSPITLGLLG